MTRIVPMFNLTAAESAAIGASVMVGIFFGTIFGGYLTDAIGRKKMFTIDIIAIAVFSILSVFATTPLQLVLARFFIGVFVGADYPIATSLIAEFTPKKHRSVSMGMVSAAWYLGATVAAVVGIASTASRTAGNGCLKRRCAVRHSAGRHDIPESPMWLAQKGASKRRRMSYTGFSATTWSSNPKRPRRRRRSASC
ncbi:MAG: MFS transporter [Slackia sp.]